MTIATTPPTAEEEAGGFKLWMHPTTFQPIATSIKTGRNFLLERVREFE